MNIHNVCQKYIENNMKCTQVYLWKRETWTAMENGNIAMENGNRDVFERWK